MRVGRLCQMDPATLRFDPYIKSPICAQKPTVAPNWMDEVHWMVQPSVQIWPTVRLVAGHRTLASGRVRIPGEL